MSADAICCEVSAGTSADAMRMASVNIILRALHTGGVAAAHEGEHDILRVAAAAPFLICNSMCDFGSVCRALAFVVFRVFHENSFLSQSGCV